MTDERNPYDVPIEPVPDATPLWACDVVDLGDFRVRMGFSRRHAGECKHLHLTYSVKERRVWCDDCERTVDNFDAFMILARHCHGVITEARHRQEKADAAFKAVLGRVAAKKLDRAWSGRNPMAVMCPHCHSGLLPEDFQNGGSQISREIELARRKKAETERRGK